MTPSKANSLPGKKGHLLAFIAGLILPLSLAPFHIYPMALVSLTMLFLLLQHLSPRQAALRAWIFGLGMFGFGINWIFVSIHVYGHTSVPLAIFITLFAFAALSLFPAATGWFSLKVLRLHRGSEAAYLHTELLVLLPASWALLEWFRGWFLTGFPWLNPGYSQVQGPLAGYAPIIGVYGVNWVLAICSGLLALIILRWPRLRKRYIAGLLLIIFTGSLLNQVEWTEPKGEPIKVSLLQGNIDQAEKWKPGQLHKTLNLYLQMTRQNWDSDVIIWPEAALSAWYHTLESSFIRPLEREARANNTDMLIGVPIYEFETKSKYNSVFSLTQGERMYYHKYHLLPFGDFLPFEDYLRGLLRVFDLPMSSFSAGIYAQPPLEVAGHKVNISICYEDVFGEEIIRDLPDASFLVNVSNDSWWGDTSGPHQHMQIAAMRSLETGRPLVRSTNNGVTGVVDYKGNIIETIPQFEVGVLTTEIQPRKGSTPFVALGNTFLITLLMGIILSTLLWRWHMRRRFGSRQ